MYILSSVSLFFRKIVSTLTSLRHGEKRWVVYLQNAYKIDKFIEEIAFFVRRMTFSLVFLHPSLRKHKIRFISSSQFSVISLIWLCCELGSHLYMIAFIFYFARPFLTVKFLSGWLIKMCNNIYGNKFIPFRLVIARHQHNQITRKFRYLIMKYLECWCDLRYYYWEFSFLWTWWRSFEFE